MIPPESFVSSRLGGEKGLRPIHEEDMKARRIAKHYTGSAGARKE